MKIMIWNAAIRDVSPLKQKTEGSPYRNLKANLRNLFCFQMQPRVFERLRPRAVHSCRVWWYPGIVSKIQQVRDLQRCQLRLQTNQRYVFVFWNIPSRLNIQLRSKKHTVNYSTYIFLAAQTCYVYHDGSSCAISLLYVRFGKEYYWNNLWIGCLPFVELSQIESVYRLWKAWLLVKVSLLSNPYVYAHAFMHNI